MKTFLLLVMLFQVLGGLVAAVTAKSAIHEIYSGVWFISATISLVGFAIVSELKGLRAPTAAQPQPEAKPSA